MDKSRIEWTDATWNPIRGCSKVSAGCANCYAERVASRFSGPGLPYAGTITNGRWNGSIKLVPEVLDQPLRWKRPRRIFVNSMSDLFHENLEFHQIAEIFGVMTGAPQHTFQILTKRPARMLEFFHWIAQTPTACADKFPAMTCHELAALRLKKSFTFWNQKWPLPNMWLGVSVEDQKTANERIPILLRTPAALRWISAEPLVGSINLNFIPADGAVISSLRGARPAFPPLDWVVTGGESGPGARSADPNWYRELQVQCRDSGTPFFFKQWGEWAPVPADESFRGALYSATTGCARIGKLAAGRQLDGKEYSEYPGDRHHG